MKQNVAVNQKVVRHLSACPIIYKIINLYKEVLVLMNYCWLTAGGRTEVVTDGC